MGRPLVIAPCARAIQDNTNNALKPVAVDLGGGGTEALQHRFVWRFAEGHVVPIIAQLFRVAQIRNFS